MLYLIGGAPRCGKGTIRREMFDRYKVEGLSTDTLRCML
jgi:2-phosphoglycerate kinase